MLGIIVSVTLITNNIQGLDPIYQFGINCIICVVFALLMFKMIEEPKISNSMRKSRKNKAYYKQIGALLTELYRACKANRNLIIGWTLLFFAIGPVCIFEEHLKNWLK